MKKFLILLILMALHSVLLTAQISEESAIKAYPAEYSFESAEALAEQGDIEIALWHYINLYPTDQERAVQAVKGLKEAVEGDLSVAIQQAFSVYGPWDPKITTIIDSTPNLNMAEFQRKGAAGDALILRTSSEDLGDRAAQLNKEGIAYMEDNFFEQAIEKFSEAIELRDEGAFRFNRGFVYTMTGRHQQAIEDFTSCINSLTRVAESYFERGFNHDQLGNADAAIADYTLAIAVNRNYSQAYNNRGFVHFNQGRYDKALADYNMAIRINPAFAGAYVNRGFLYLELAQNENACRDWGKASDFGLTNILGTILKHCSEDQPAE